MSNFNQSYNRGTSNGLFLLFLVFLVLKLTNHIDWSWWWITAPLWGMAAFLLTIVIVCLAGAFLIDVMVQLFDWFIRPFTKRK